MKNNEDCSFWIYTDEDETNIESFDRLFELMEICSDNGLNWEEQMIHLGEGECVKLSDEDFIGFYKLPFITDIHLKEFEMGILFKHQ